LPEEWKELIVVPIYKKGNKADCSNYRGISILSTTHNILSNSIFQMSRLPPSAGEIIGIISVTFDVTGQLMFLYSAIVE
jgi:hypothetical protein